MSFLTLGELPEKELIPGFRARFIHTSNLTIAHWTIREGSQLPEHAHIHEMVVTVREGRFELTVNGETREMSRDDIAVIPSNVPHSGRALTDCRIMDVWYPVREDYRDL